MVLQHAQSSSRMPWNKLEPARIFATTGALALNIAILLLLLVPAARLVPVFTDKPITTVDLDQKKELPPPLPPPIEKARIEPRHDPKPAPTIVQPKVDTPQVTDQIVVDDGLLPAITDTLPTQTASATITPTAPLQGVALEYQAAPPPKYTRELILARAEGTVYLQVLVDVDGKPIDVSVQKSSGIRQLDELARRTVLRNWIFRPATKDGHPVQAIGIVPIDFKLG